MRQRPPATTAPPPVARVRVSTDAMPASQRAAYWSDLVCAELIQAEIRTLAEPLAFQGCIERTPVQGLDICRVRSTAQSVSRTPAMVAHGQAEHILVNIQRSGIGYVTQDGKTAKLLPGQMVLYTTARPYSLDFEAAFEQTVLIIPAGEWQALAGRSDAVFAQTLPGHTVPNQLLLGLADQAAAWGDHHLQHPQDKGDAPASLAATATVKHLRQALLHTLAATVEADLPALASARPSPRSKLSAYHLARIQQAIEQHLRDPALGVERIAALVSLSPAHIHRLFETQAGTLSATIRQQRLQACRRDLLDPAQAHRTISEIAFDWGFNQAAHFSRSFKQAFGMTPLECRQHRRRA